MSVVNYSKWDHIEVSDDEDDTHPNIDTPSLFRWRHQARVERDQKFSEEKGDFEKQLKEHIQQYEKCKKDLQEARRDKSEKISELEKRFEVLEVENEKWEQRKLEWHKKERLRPWNIDTICHEGKSKSMVNKADFKHDEKPSLDDDAAIDRLKSFVDKHKKTIQKFGMFQKSVDTQTFLVEHPYLVCDETANHLVLWCIDLAIEEKFDLLDHVSHQCIVMQFMLELAKSLKCDPRAVIRPFFAKFINPEPEYLKAFQDELDAFRQRIRNRAKVRVEEAVEKYEEEERQKRLGPGGLDPIDVFDSLPKELQACFESKDVGLLKNALIAMDPKDAEYHMNRCIASGLWLENADESANADGLSPTTQSDSIEKDGSTNGLESVGDVYDSTSEKQEN